MYDMYEWWWLFKHTVSFTRVDKNLKDWSKATKKFLLHAIIVTIAADAPAGEVQYHLNCYTDLRYEADKAKKSFPNKTKQDVYDSLVIAQLIIYMTESREVFKLATLKVLYKQKLAELGRPCENDKNSTRFKEHLLDNLPGWTAVLKGNHVFLSHTSTVGKVVAEANENQGIEKDDAILLMKAASILRKHSLVLQKPFNGSFDANSISRSVPELLYTFMNALLQGSKESIDSSNNDSDKKQRTKVTLGICKIITYNIIKRAPLEKK